MAAKVRDEIVGKRFLSVTGGSKLKLCKITEWDWRAGVIRACTHRDFNNPDLQVLVEYDDVTWRRREWVQVYRDRVFQIFLLEHTLAWATRRHPLKRSAGTVLWPALLFEPLVDQVGISEHKFRPVEYLVDKVLDYHDYAQLQLYQDQDGEEYFVEDEVAKAVKSWLAELDGQRILLTTPSVLAGFRVQVYRAEGTTQWYTAVIVGYNDSTRELTVTDDTVLEEHSEDPCLVQIRLIGEGVVESILRGENVGITPRRSRSATNNHHQTGVRHIRRDLTTSSSRGKKSNAKATAVISPVSSPGEKHSRTSGTTGLDDDLDSDESENVLLGSSTKEPSSTGSGDVVHPKQPTAEEAFDKLQEEDRKASLKAAAAVASVDSNLSNAKLSTSSSQPSLNLNNSGRVKTEETVSAKSEDDDDDFDEDEEKTPLLISSSFTSLAETKEDSEDSSSLSLSEQDDKDKTEKWSGRSSRRKCNSSDLTPSSDLPLSTTSNKQNSESTTKKKEFTSTTLTQKYNCYKSEDSSRTLKLTITKPFGSKYGLKSIESSDANVPDISRDCPVADKQSDTKSKLNHQTNEKVKSENNKINNKIKLNKTNIVTNPLKRTSSEREGKKNTKHIFADTTNKPLVKLNKYKSPSESLSDKSDTEFIPKKSKTYKSINNNAKDKKDICSPEPVDASGSDDCDSTSSVDSTPRRHQQPRLAKQSSGEDLSSSNASSNTSSPIRRPTRKLKVQNSSSSDNTDSDSVSNRSTPEPESISHISNRKPAIVLQRRKSLESKVPQIKPQINNGELKRTSQKTPNKPLATVPPPQPEPPPKQEEEKKPTTDLKEAKKAEDTPVKEESLRFVRIDRRPGSLGDSSKNLIEGNTTQGCSSDSVVSVTVTTTTAVLSSTTSSTQSSTTQKSKQSGILSSTEQNTKSSVEAVEKPINQVTVNTTCSSQEKKSDISVKPTVTGAKLSLTDTEPATTSSNTGTKITSTVSVTGTKSIISSSSVKEIKPVTSSSIAEIKSTTTSSSFTETKSTTSNSVVSGTNTTFTTSVTGIKSSNIGGSPVTDTKSINSSATVTSTTVISTRPNSPEIEIVKAIVEKPKDPISKKPLSPIPVSSSCSVIVSQATSCKSIAKLDNHTGNNQSLSSSVNLPLKPLNCPPSKPIIAPTSISTQSSSSSKLVNTKPSLTTPVTCSDLKSTSTSSPKPNTTIQTPFLLPVCNKKSGITITGVSNAVFSKPSPPAESGSSSVFSKPSFPLPASLKNSLPKATDLIKVESTTSVLSVVSTSLTKSSSSIASECTVKPVQCTNSISLAPICDSSQVSSKCIISTSVVSNYSNVNSISKHVLTTSSKEPLEIRKSSALNSGPEIIPLPITTPSADDKSDVILCTSEGQAIDKNSALTVSVTSVTSVPRVSTPAFITVTKTNVKTGEEGKVTVLPVSASSSNNGSLEVAGVVSGRAVTITATSGPAPQGNTRVASPPSVSITAVVRNSGNHSQNSSELAAPTHHHEGAPSTHYHQHSATGPQGPYHHYPQSSANPGSQSTTSRMDQCDGSSDSGVSVTERSVSRSSVLSDDRSSSAEVKPNTPTPTTATIHSKAYPTTVGVTPLVVDRKEPVRVWRDPAILSQSEQTVRHIHSLPHNNMSHNYAGVAPHHSASPGSQSGSHPTSHPSAHGPPPPPAPTLHHGLPPGLPYAQYGPAPPHLPPGLHPPLNAAAAAMYPQLIPHVSPLQHYTGLMPHPDEMIAREIERERHLSTLATFYIERREAEAREKAKEKMEREIREREEMERRERERREEREREENERQKQKVNQHFEESLRLAHQKRGIDNLRQLTSDPLHSAYFVQNLPNQHTVPHNSLLLSQQQQQHQQNKNYQLHMQKVVGWNQSGLGIKLEQRDRREEERRYMEHKHNEDLMRRAREPEKMVNEIIFKAFGKEDRPRESSKSQGPPPPAHSVKAQLDKTSVTVGYPIGYQPKEVKTSHPSERVPFPMHHEKQSVIVQPEVKYEKTTVHAMSPKPRHPERSSPYQSNSAYKVYETSQSPHRSAPPPHHSIPSTTHVDMIKIRQPQSSPHSNPSPVLSDRYYHSSKPPTTTSYASSSLINQGLVPNPIHVAPVQTKPKVGSPPPQMYGKPGITTGTPVCRVDIRPTQAPPIPNKPLNHLTTPPPPAHSGNRGRDQRAPAHEQRPTYERPVYDRIHPPTVPSPHHKSVVAPGPQPHPVQVPQVSSPLIATTHAPPIQTSPPPTQTQPLDLGTRDDTSSPAKRRTQTPNLQDAKKPRLESNSNQPTLSRVSEPSPLYPSAATTITTVENTVAFNNIPRSSSPVVSRPSSRPQPATTPTLQRNENSSSPGTKCAEPEKSVSPSPNAGYVHKLKKAWLQRHESGVEIPPGANGVGNPSAEGNTNSNSNGNSPPPSSGSTSRVNTPPPSNVTNKNSSNTTTTVPKQEKPIVRKPKVNIPNGHSQDLKEPETSSTDSESSSTTTKSKRTKGKRNLKRAKKSSDSNSDSESDTSESGGKKMGRPSSKQDSEPKKRGRKPKTKNEKEKIEPPKSKKLKEEPPQNDPLLKPPIAQLKKTGESFLQAGSCYEVAPKLPKCRECRWTAHQRNKKMPNIFCRFYAFRRLRYTKNGQLAVAGFSDPEKDAYGEDLNLWVPYIQDPSPDLNIEMSKFLLEYVGDQFCDLVKQEQEAMALHMGEDSVTAWKRVVLGVREMCDVCETTLFNIHWACSKCGFVVCIDCYKGRKNGTVKIWNEGGKERDEYAWLLCASRVPHEQDKLMLTQIIAGNALLDLGKKVHEIRHLWGIPQYCDCPEAKQYKDEKKVNGINKDLMLKNVKKEIKSEMVNGNVKTEKSDKDKVNGKEEDVSNLNLLTSVALSQDKKEGEDANSDSESDSDKDSDNGSTLRELLVRPNSNSAEDSSKSKEKESSNKKKVKLHSLDDVFKCVIDNPTEEKNCKKEIKVELKHFIRKYNYNRRGREMLPTRIMTKAESSVLYPNVKHSWLCDGKLLRLIDSYDPLNVGPFQEHWKRGQPVLISGVGQKLNQDLWKPSNFSRDFGECKNDLINCITGNIVPNQPMKRFWDGFDHYSKRLKDDKGQPMLLKLKDWPPGEDFAEMLPKRFEDLMKILPLGQYTRRTGCLNLAGRLPDCFVRPDLGPKLYVAYGSATNPDKASTNLHLDISDAVNVMCYVGIPKDANYEQHVKDVWDNIDESGCDVLTMRRAREKDSLPGALWHIYHARDSDKIRDLLNKVAIERGDKLEPHHDPIHDQSWYLDPPLRERLYNEYGVEGYPIVQCTGDAVFIPAGAPHQVRNLHNCIKVAEDFVSPENVSHCFHLTQEFRHLSDTHTNHEDKLQIKNIIYHAMKDAIAVLMAAAANNQDTKPAITEDKKIKTEPDS